MENNPNPKISLVLTGHLRTFNQTYPNWKSKFIDPYNADLFLNLWDNIGNRLDLTPGEISPKQGSLASALFSSEEVNKEELIQLCNPKDLEIENYLEIKKSEQFAEKLQPTKDLFQIHKMGLRRMDWFLSQYYKRLKGIQKIIQYEKENNIKYDFVMLSRPDFSPGYFPKHPRVTEVKNFHGLIPWDQMNKNELYLTKISSSDQTYHDFYMIGNSTNIKRICEIYHKLEQLTEYFKIHDLNYLSDGHSLLTTHLQLNLNDVKINEVPLIGYILR